jgi:hypothetical protein
MSFASNLSQSMFKVTLSTLLTYSFQHMKQNQRLSTSLTFRKWWAYLDIAKGIFYIHTYAAIRIR